jgi:hypothetical protein
MKSIIDARKVGRRAALSHVASLGGLLVMLGSVGLSLWRPALQTLTTGLLLVGVVCATVGIYHANRWVKRPRPEDILDRALRSLDDRCRLYHYAFVSDHVLLTTADVVILETINLEGWFTFDSGRWRQRFSVSRAMRYLLEQRLGDPLQRAEAYAAWMRSFLEENLPDGCRPPVGAIVVFVHPAAQLTLVSSPSLPICQPERLAKYLPKGHSKLSSECYERVRELFDSKASPVPPPR